VAEFVQSREIDVGPEAVWRLVSDPSRLADWVPTTSASHPAGEDAVWIRGESHGHGYETRGGFETDDETRCLSWSSPRRSGYRGVLTVAESGSGSRVTVCVTIPGIPADAEAELDRGLAETLDRIGGLTGG
jgi:uncharacterized protein YndB with AHSA1/START domain